MSEEKKPPVNIEIGASAKAEFRAEIKTEIPPESSGRLLDALTDIIRPFSEARGFKADRIRLQREEMAVKIAQMGVERIKLSSRDHHPILNRVLVPLLEAASLTEEGDYDLANAWAHTIASASTNTDPNHVVFVDVLSKLSSVHLKFIEFLATNGQEDVYSYADAPAEYRSHYVRQYLEKMPIIPSDKENAADKILEYMRSFKTKRGVAISCGGFEYPNDSDGDYYELDGDYSLSQFPESILQALAALNVVRIEILDDVVGPAGAKFWLEYIYFTSFGSEFYSACVFDDPDLAKAET